MDGRRADSAWPAVVSLTLLTCAETFAQAPLRGFPPQQWPAQHQFEETAKTIPQKERIGTYLRRMSAKPHVAGSAGSKAVADYALGQFKEWGLDARIEVFEGLLPYPTARVLEMTAPVPFRAKLEEPAIPPTLKQGVDGDPIPAFNAYGATGDVRGKLVYVNFGLPEDYEVLKKRGVDVKGKVVIARYGKGWRGAKVKAAQDNGAIACLLYSDPNEDGYLRGAVFPNGPMRPEQGVQRGTVLDLVMHPGDPLSPGWASEPGSKRLLRSEAKVLPKIPVLPISYGDAEPLLRRLESPALPAGWKGALPIAYRSGPGPAEVHVKTDFDWSNKPLHDVIAVIPGSVYKDQWIVYGNHHDAWVTGANDPGSGASVLLETARTLAALRKQGWQPKRTVVLALWDGEEFGLIGSTEWVEKHGRELDQKAAVYINTDATGTGRLDASGSMTLETFLSQVLRDVSDPLTSRSLLNAAERTGKKKTGERTRFELRPLGGGSDYVPFLNHAGVPSLNLGFISGEASGVYHSRYDNYAWYETFSDRDFTYGVALSRLMTTALVRLADAPVLPLEFRNTSRTLQRHVQELQAEARKHGVIADLTAVSTEIARLDSTAIAFERGLTGLLGGANSVSTDRLIKINEALARAERALLDDDGLPGREWYRHQLYAPSVSNGYDSRMLPGVREAMEAGRWDEANQQARRLAGAVRSFREKIDDVNSRIRLTAP